MNVLHETYGDKVEFLWVYIREAHPSDGSQVQANITEGIILPAPRTYEQRETYATQAAEYLKIGFTTVIDTMDDRVESLYSAWPLRQYLVGLDGRLVYAGAVGPPGYIPSQLESAMRSYLGLDGVTSVSSASYAGPRTAPGSIVAAFGSSLAGTTEAAASLSLPHSLGGVSVKITDSAGSEAAAPLFFVSPSQVNYLLPSGIAEGPAVVTFERAGQDPLRGPLLVKKAAPGVFTANSDGQGVPAAYAIRVGSGGVPGASPVYQWDAERRRHVPAPIHLDAPGDRVFLILFGTGLRGAAAVEVAIGGVKATVEWHGAHGLYPGLDQVNVLIPPALSGRGALETLLSADGIPANPVTVRID